MSKNLRRPLKSWRISETVSLREMLEWAVEKRGADRALVVGRLDFDLEPPTLFEPAVEDSAHAIFRNKLLRSVYCSAWPGSRLAGGYYAKIYIGQVDRSVIDRMVSAEERWTEWVNSRGLPEDFCFWKHGSSAPLIVTVTHERDAWLFDAGPVPDWAVEDADTTTLQEFIPPPPSFVVLAQRGSVGRRQQCER